MANQHNRPVGDRVIDGHNDVLLALEEAERGGRPLDFKAGAPELQVSGPAAREGGFAGGFFACFTPDELNGPDLDDEVIVTEQGWEIPYAEPVARELAVDTVVALVARLLELERAGALRIARKVTDVERSVDGGRPAAILHIEGAEAIDPDDLRFLDVLHAAGLRSVGPVWSRPNAFGHGVPFRYPGSPDVGPGLTEAGRRLVEACNAKGILVDLAHLNLAGFEDVARLTTRPLVVSHSAAHALCPTARNLLDGQLDLIAESGGLVGVIANTADLRGNREEGRGAGIDDVVAHAEYLAGRMGVEHVALGSDWNGATVPQGLESCARLPDLLGRLRGVGWSEADVRRFAHENWLRVLRDTWR
jgi:membrane dipeptidase